MYMKKIEQFDGTGKNNRGDVLKKSNKMMDIDSIDISLEEFDKLDGDHEFSKEYKENKREMLKEYRKKKATGTSKRVKVAKVAAACVACLIATPVIANAATDGALFNRLWGNEGKENMESHDEILYDEEKGSSCVVTYPEREYVEVDEEKAEELVGETVSYPNIVKDIDGTTLTIISAVRDKNSAVVEFTLEKEGGVDMNYSQLDNEAKGAWFSDDSTYWFEIGDTGNMFVDLERSTPEKLYIYDYAVCGMNGFNPSNLMLHLTQYPCKRSELNGNLSEEEWNAIMADTVESTIVIPTANRVPYVEFVNAEGGIIEISSLSMKITDMSIGLGLTPEQAYDPFYCSYVSVNYEDGTNYVVKETNIEGIHSCEVEVDNTGYACGGSDNSLVLVFNRLVDVDTVKSITVNGTEYTLKK